MQDAQIDTQKKEKAGNSKLIEEFGVENTKIAIQIMTGTIARKTS